MVYFIVNQQTKCGFKFKDAGQMYQVAQQITDFDKKYETYSIGIDIDHQGRIVMTDKGHEDLEDGVVIGHAASNMSEKEKSEQIKEIESNLLLIKQKLGYKFDMRQHHHIESTMTC